jgi:L-histidine N-alpha-methyltransferase
VGSPKVAIDVYLDEAGALASMAEEVRAGLTASPKVLLPKYFYDERGSWLFEKITELPEYYLTRAERSLLKDDVGRIAEITRPSEIVELGPGSAVKTQALLEAGHAVGTLKRYVPVEVSAAMVEHSAERLSEAYPWLEIHAVVGDFEQHLEKVPAGENRMVALLGSTIGNLPRPDAVEFLKEIRELLDEGGHLLLGTDLVKERAVLEAAYNDSQGVTADFNRNVLRVINHQLGGDFDPESFEHVAIYSESRERMEIYLDSTRSQKVNLKDLDLEVSFDKGERMRTEVSCKYTRSSVSAMLDEAGLSLDEWFTGPDGAFALSLASPATIR